MVQKSLLSDTPENLIYKYHLLLKKKSIPVEQIILFGSYANGTATEDSDLDVCVVSDDFGKDSFDEMVMLSKISHEIEPLIEPHPYNPIDLRNRWDPLATEIRNTGKVIIDYRETDQQTLSNLKGASTDL